MPVCRECIEEIYKSYLSQCNNTKDAVRQVCRKLDMYWNENAFEQVERRNTTRTIMTSYIQKINNITYAGKCYDDTLAEDGTLWNFNRSTIKEVHEEPTKETVEEIKPELSVDLPEISPDGVAFWGNGYSPEMYIDLEQRRTYWMSKFPKDIDMDIGTEALIRQICSLELDINRDRAAGRAVDKSVNALNTLLGSASLKPAQKKSDSDSSLYNTPMGVWIDRFEYKRPIPDAETEETKNYLTKYILSWFSGHLSKMFGVKNANTKLYEEEIAKYRVSRPDFDDDSDDDLMYDILSDVESDINSNYDISPMDGEDLDVEA